jgi:GTP-binding protein
MKKSIYQNATFLLSVANLSQLPPDRGYEVAIVGRSNSGKSSVLNQLTHNKSLARVSKTPGRTQHINLFGLDEKRRIADLPGYGYAKVPPAVKRHWEQTLGEYLRSRECLKGLVLVMDIRHPLKEFDKQMLAWGTACELPMHILLNKSDKLGIGAAKKTLLEVQKAVGVLENPVSVQLFSALKGEGIKEFQDMLKEWFDF